MVANAFVYVNKDNNPVLEDRKWPGIEMKTGLEAVGFTNRCKYAEVHKKELIYPTDLLVCWTLWSHTTRAFCADNHTKMGGIVLCAENGWLRKVNGKNYYQLAKRVGRGSGINGQGSFPIGDDSRWKQWNVQLQPWRTEGNHILVCAQRGVRPGDPLITHGADWPDKVVADIRKLTDRPIWFRPHPGNNRPCLPQRHKVERIINPHVETLSQNLENAWCTVVYTSTSATDSIVAGVPVCYDGPSIMCQELAGKVKDVVSPVIKDREKVMAKLAWGQWNLEELRSGEAFRHVLGIK